MTETPCPSHRTAITHQASRDAIQHSLDDDVRGHSLCTRQHLDATNASTLTDFALAKTGRAAD